MDEKLVNYFKYIANDLVDNTKFNPVIGVVKFPFTWRIINVPGHSCMDVSDMFDYTIDDFKEYVIGTYGVTSTESIGLYFMFSNFLEEALRERDMMWEC
jgi:hypothetical protein